MISKKNLLGVDITDASQKEILEYIVKNVENFQKKLFIVTPNPEFLVLAHSNSTFKEVLNKADLASADGIGIMIAGKVLGKPLKERFTGVDLVKSLCERIAEKPITVGFLGGRDGVAEKTAECLVKMYPGLKVGFVGEDWGLGLARPLKDSLEPSGNTRVAYENESMSPVAGFYRHDSKNPVKSSFRGEPRPLFNNSTIKQSSNGAVDILFVAFGAPKQEFWINENLEKIPVKVAIGVGGAFDYLSGKIHRAPKFVRAIGMEWLFRLVVQPWRIKRQLALIEFVWLVIKEKLKNN